MESKPENEIILVAEDDDDHFLLTTEAMELAGLKQTIHRVKNGQELMQYLLRQEHFEKYRETPLPRLILLDFNMPRLNGLEFLQKIQDRPLLLQIPIVALSTTIAPEDISRGYKLGVNSFIQKPFHFKEWIKVMTQIKEYWFGTVQLP